MSLESELARRAARGHKPVTMKEMVRQLKALGYAFDRSLDSISIAQRISGEGAGDTYPVNSLYVIEADTRRSAFHHEARRDKAYERLQSLRNEELFSVVCGRIVEF